MRFLETACKTVHPMLSDCCLSVLSVCLWRLWPNGWMDQNETWNGDRPCHGHIVLDGDKIDDTLTSLPLNCLHIIWVISSPPQRNTAPNFRPMSVVAKRLDGLRCHWDGGRLRPKYVWKVCPLRINHVIRRMRSGWKRIVTGILRTGDVRTYKARTDSRRLFKLGGRIEHIIRCMTTDQGKKEKGQGHKVT